MTSSYAILERIAVGGMGEVFLARQSGVGNFKRTVVLKKLLPNLEDEDAIARMLDEARVSGVLSHENVVAIIEVGQPAGELPWIALEYVHGENASTLRQKAAKQSIPVPIVVAARIVIDAARGLHHAHKANDVDGRPLHIVHRDVAPKNIFVRHDGVSKIGDFGIAKANAKISHTETGAIAGTLSYMSPEQLTSQKLTAASDQFSLGIVLWELLTGKRLFKGEGPVDTAEKILTSKIRAPSKLREDCPAALDAIALRMLQRDVGKRFRSLEEAAEAIEAALFPEASMSVGRAAVAAFVELIAGDELRERQRRIEEGAEATVLATERPPASSASNSAPAPSAPSSSSPTSPTDPDPTVNLQERPADVVNAPVVSRPSKNFSPAPMKRMPLVAAVGAVAVFVSVALFTVLHPVDAEEEATRSYLKEMEVVGPLILREAIVVDSVAAGLPEQQAEQLASSLIDLQKQRLHIAVEHHAQTKQARARELADVVKKEKALIDRAKKELSVVADEKARDGLFSAWNWDSAAPIRWLAPPTVEQIQSDLSRGGVDYMKETSADRWATTSRLVKRAGGDAAKVRAAIEPLVIKREAMIEKFCTAPVEDLPKLEQDMKDLVVEGERILKSHVPADYARAIALTAFIELPDSKQGENVNDDGKPG